MIRFVNNESPIPVEWGPGLTMVAVESSLVGGVGSWVGGASYVRPTRIEIPGRDPIPIRDHVMLARLISGGLVLAAAFWRRLDD